MNVHLAHVTEGTATAKGTGQHVSYIYYFLALGLRMSLKNLHKSYAIPSHLFDRGIFLTHVFNYTMVSDNPEIQTDFLLLQYVSPHHFITHSDPESPTVTDLKWLSLMACCVEQGGPRPVAVSSVAGLISECRVLSRVGPAAAAGQPA